MRKGTMDEEIEKAKLKPKETLVWYLARREILDQDVYANVVLACVEALREELIEWVIL